VSAGNVRFPASDRHLPWPPFTAAAVRRPPQVLRNSRLSLMAGWTRAGGGNVRPWGCGRPNGSDPKLHGQGPRAEG
jgi:hypothetical protein